MGQQITESQAIWAIIAVVVGVDALWAWMLGIRITGILPVLLLLCFFLAIYFAYSFVRPNRTIAAIPEALAQISAFTTSAAVLVYLTVTSRFPLIDSYLAAADSNLLGFNWLSWFTWLHEHRAINALLTVSYFSLTFSVLIIIIVLPALGKVERLREFIFLYVLTSLIITAFAWIFPAESAWAYFGVTHRVNAYHLADFTALRDGRMHEISLARVDGIVTFPSFHAALALLLIFAARGIRIVFPLSFTINALVIASTPSAGGHYLIDVLAGLAVVPLAIFILRSWVPHREIEAIHPASSAAIWQSGYGVFAGGDESHDSVDGVAITSATTEPPCADEPNVVHARIGTGRPGP